MKDEILKIAIQQMRSGGYENLNFAHIAAELGTSRANLHHHFKNKEGLGIAATAQYIEYDRAFKQAILSANHHSFKTMLTALEHQMAAFLANNKVGDSCILSQLVHDGEAPESLRRLAIDRYKEEESVLLKYIVDAQKRGEVADSKDPQKLAFQLMSALFGIIQMGLVKSDKSEFVSGVEGLLTAYLD